MTQHEFRGDSDLLLSIRATAIHIYGVCEYDQVKASQATARLVSRYFREPIGCWAWESTAFEPVEIAYGTADGLSIITKFVGDLWSEALLFVTDEQFPPWPIFKGKLIELIEIIRQQNYFEFILTDIDQSSIVIDTHHNDLLIGGAIKDRARLY